MIHTFDTPGPVAIEIRHRAGDIELDLTDTRQTTVEFTAAEGPAIPWFADLLGPLGEMRPAGFDDDPAARAVADFSAVPGPDTPGGRLLVDTRAAGSSWRSRLAVRITAPRSSSVRIGAPGADVRISGTVGALDARTASGDVVTEDCGGDVRLTTASGNIRLGRVAGALTCQTASGDVQVGSVGGRVSAQTTSGDVRLDGAGGDITVRTVSGDVTVGDVRSGVIRLATVAGDVDLALHEGVLASVGLSSVSGGIVSDLTVAAAPPADTAEASRSGRADIRVRTISGDIRLRRRSPSPAGPDADGVGQPG